MQPAAAVRKNQGKATARDSAAETGVRLVGALLALAVAAVHIADQGGLSAFASPSWIGWGYRLIELSGALLAVTLLLPRSRFAGPTPFPWAAALLLGTGPFVAYVASRTVGLPGDAGDVGNWGYWVGTVSLFVEAALIMLSASMLVDARQRRAADARPRFTRF
jgi:hypothetical protein